MKGLKCTTCNCEFNRACHCNAGVIKVGKTGVCETRQKRRYGIIQQNSVNIEAAKDFDYESGKEVLIHCECAGLMRTKCFSKEKK